jgi:cytosine permease
MSVRHGTPGMPGNHDFSTSRAGIVPRDQRRPMWHFMGLWTTLVAGFSFMVPGFVMYDGGITLGAAAGASLLGYGIYVAYALAGSYLGAQTGQTLTLLTRAVFGRIGSWLVSLLVMIPALGWVGFQAGVLVRLWHGFYGWPQLAAITVALAAVMIFNNLFGFAGISLFARNLVTPVLVRTSGGQGPCRRCGRPARADRNPRRPPGVLGGGGGGDRFRDVGK